MNMLTNKSFLVVGASGLLGKEITAALLNAGANVMAADIDTPAHDVLNSDTSTSGRLETTQLDIRDAISVSEAIHKSTMHFGGLDGAVNCAYPRNKNYGRHFFDVTYDDFCDNLSGHVGGYFVVMQQCAKYASEQSRAFSLVNLSSIYGVISPRFSIYQDTTMTMPVEYAAIKSAIQHLTRYATAYCKGTDLRVNCVSPGGIKNGQDLDFVQAYQSQCNSKGMLDAADITGTVLFLCSDASHYIRGQNIIVDDGFSN